ncbi:MAG: hypothetical protein WBQ23_13500 [Bacteroidota bacterium]
MTIETGVKLGSIASVAAGLLMIFFGYTYVPYHVICNYGNGLSGEIGHHFIFDPPSSEEALHLLVDSRSGWRTWHAMYTRTNFSEKVAATEVHILTPLQTNQRWTSTIYGIGCLFIPVALTSWKRQEAGRRQKQQAE